MSRIFNTHVWLLSEGSKGFLTFYSYNLQLFTMMINCNFTFDHRIKNIIDTFKMMSTLCDIYSVSREDIYLFIVVILYFRSSNDNETQTNQYI